MMDAGIQAEAGRRLELALARAGLVIERVELAQGNVRGWEAVSGATILGRLLAATGWRVRLEEPTS